jgi:Ni,Fe-hydrogenase III large subunit
MCEGQSLEKCLYISERISGDETFANSLAYCQAIEKIAETQVPLRAQYIQELFLQSWKRLTSHLGDLARDFVWTPLTVLPHISLECCVAGVI